MHFGLPAAVVEIATEARHRFPCLLQRLREFVGQRLLRASPFAPRIAPATAQTRLSVNWTLK
jgi:hypothetical protein